jgi:2'-5' RNA ligase
MRLFIAVNFDMETRNRLMAVQDRLRAAASGTFTHSDNLHLTLVFLGETEQNRIPAVKKAVDTTKGESTRLTFDHTGSFRRRGGDIWWVGLRKNTDLERIQRSLCDKLAHEGFILKKRTFSPHITLARRVVLRRQVSPDSLMSEPFETNLDAISLMRSDRINGKLTYTELYRRKLQH